MNHGSWFDSVSESFNLLFKVLYFQLISTWWIVTWPLDLVDCDWMSVLGLTAVVIKNSLDIASVSNLGQLIQIVFFYCKAKTKQKQKPNKKRKKKKSFFYSFLFFVFLFFFPSYFVFFFVLLYLSFVIFKSTMGWGIKQFLSRLEDIPHGVALSKWSRFIVHASLSQWDRTHWIKAESPK